MLGAFLAGGITAGIIGLIALIFRVRGRELGTGQLVALAIPVALAVFFVRHRLPFSGPAGPAVSSEELTQQMLKESPALELLTREHPEVRAGMVQMLDSVIASGASRREAFTAGMTWGRSVLSPYFRQYLAVASDESLVAFGKASTDLLEGLRKTPDACMDYLFGPNGRTVSRVSEKDQARLGKVMEQVIRSGIDSPHDKMPPDQARKTVQSLTATLIQKWGTSCAAALEQFSNPVKAREEPGQSCNVAYQLYRYVVTLPPDEAAATLRALFSAI